MTAAEYAQQALFLLAESVPSWRGIGLALAALLMIVAVALAYQGTAGMDE